MSWEEISALSTFGTLIVIAASAIAAVVQLRHMRSGNQISATLGLFDKWAGPEARRLQAYVFSGEVDKKLEDPAYRAGLMRVPVDRVAYPEVSYLDFWEAVSTLVKLGHTDESAFMETGGFTALAAWNKLMPVIAIIRRARGPTVYDNFEYTVSRAIIWEAKHPDTFPKDAPRLPVVDPYPEDLASHVP
jgi:hypothetical protein